VLKKDPSNVKALYRRAVARNHLGLPEEAIEDLTAALALDPENKAVKGEVVKAKKLMADAKKKVGFRAIHLCIVWVLVSFLRRLPLYIID
jgi:tetratricopeptide (TPR) repeat protein